MTVARPILVAVILTACHSESAASPGETLFLQRCAMCHTLGRTSGQGPGLGGLAGRKAGTLPGFAYSSALRSSSIVWDLKTLDHFLENPSAAVPGTVMPISVPIAEDRKLITGYLMTLGQPPPPPKRPAPTGVAPSSVATPATLTGKSAFGGYRSDGPGVRRKITVADLPPPYASDSARNSPSVVGRPKGFDLHVPPGFSVSLFAEGLNNPRLTRVAPNGDVFIAETAANRVRVLRAADGAAKPDTVEVFADGLDQPFGISFYPPGADPRWMYVANTNSVVRFAYKSGDLHASAAPETVVPRLTGSGGGHSTRDVVFSRDGKRMFVSVGSGSNVGESIAPLPVESLPAFESAHAMGSDWDYEEWRADVLSFDPTGRDRRVFATGIRNCVGLAVNPTTGDVWCSVNERDGLGDDLVPDYVTRVREGAFYGWPWFYMGDHQDPRHKNARPDLAGHVTVPDVLVQPHSASLAMTFYDGAMFPPDYKGNAFAAFHGSWNRALRTGYKVVRVIVKDGVPTGEYEDFLTGFAVDDDSVWGRPVGVAVAHDGALLVTEDGNGTVWRVAYGK